MRRPVFGFLCGLAVASAVAPTHCAGDLATGLFRAAYGPEFQAAGAGRRLALG